MKTIDPATSLWINVAALVLSAFATAVWWVDLIGAHAAVIVTGVMNTVVSALNLVLHGLSSSDKGPLVR